MHAYLHHKSLPAPQHALRSGLEAPPSQISPSKRQNKTTRIIDTTTKSDNINTMSTEVQANQVVGHEAHEPSQVTSPVNQNGGREASRSSWLGRESMDVSVLNAAFIGEDCDSAPGYDGEASNADTEDATPFGKVAETPGEPGPPPNCTTEGDTNAPNHRNTSETSGWAAAALPTEWQLDCKSTNRKAWYNW